MRRVLREGAGQATVEFVAVVPLLLLAALAIGQWLAAGAARELARAAAEAGAIARLQGDGPADAAVAARAAVPGADRDRLHIVVRGRRVAVTVRPVTVVPGVAALLDATAVAVAGEHA